MKHFLTILFLISGNLFLLAAEDSPLILTGVNSNGQPYNTVPGFYLNISNEAPSLQLGNGCEMTFRFPPYPQSTINRFDPRTGKSNELLPIDYFLFGQAFKQYSYQHTSSSDFSRHFILINRQLTTSIPKLVCYTDQILAEAAFPQNAINLEESRMILASDNSTVLIYDNLNHVYCFMLRFQNGKYILEKKSLPVSSDFPVIGAAFANQGDTLFYLQNKKILRLDGIRNGHCRSREILSALRRPVSHSLQCTEDGTRVIYCDEIPWPEDLKNPVRTILFSADVNQLTSSPLPFTSSYNNYNEPALTPDGRFLAFTMQTVTPEQGNSQIWRWDFLTEELLQISTHKGTAADSACLAPAISPDGRHIAFITQAPAFLNAFGINAGVHQIFLKKNIPITDKKDLDYKLVSYLASDMNQAPAPWGEEGHSYSSLQMDEKGENLIFRTNANLSKLSHNTANLYLRSLPQNKILLQNNADFPAVSGDGKSWAFYQNNALHLTDSRTISAELEAPPLLSYHGQSVLFADIGRKKLVHHNLTTGLQNTIPGQLKLYSGALSRNGDEVLFLNEDNQLEIWTAADGQSQNLNITSPIQACMSAYGSIIYYKDNNNQICRYNRLNQETKLLAVPHAAQVFQLRCSGNGRYLSYLKSNEKDIYILYRFDVHKGTELTIASGIEFSPQGNFAVSYSGDKIVFSSSDTFTARFHDMNSTNDLYMAILLEDANTPPELLPPEVLTMTEDRPAEFHFQFTDAEGDDACLIKAETNPAQGTAVILPPSSAHPWYSVQISPAQDFDGTLNLKLTVSDGRDARTQNFSIIVENVNDKPVWSAEFQPVTMQEKSSRTINLNAYASDPDLRNPANQEKLSFALTEECPWATISADGILSLEPDQNTVLHQKARKDFQIKLIITDQEKAESEIQILPVTVEDLNHTPAISFAENAPRNITENTLISTAWFICNDLDKEDQGNLQLTLTAASGTFNSTGQTSITMAANSSSEIQYTPGNGSNTDTISVSCRDSLNAESGKLTLTVHLKQIDLETANFWSLATKGSIPSPDSIRIHAGKWNLLSLPVTAQAKALLDAFPGSVLRWWNAAEQRYLVADDKTLLPAGTGFWLYCNALPDTLPQLTGERRLETAYPTLTPGWHLLGPIQGLSGDFKSAEFFPQNLPTAGWQEPVFLKPDSTYKPPTGTAAWIYLPEAQQ